MFSDVENSTCYVFVGAPTGPDPRRAPGATRGGPRGGPDPRRAPGEPRGGPRRGPGEGPGEGPGPRGGPQQGPGPDARAKRALDSSKYNISSPEDNDSTKLVISVRAGSKPPAGRITNFVRIVFLG